MGLSREQIDRIIDEHFGFEATDNVDGVLGSLADDAEHEIIPSPLGRLNDRASIRRFYEQLFRDLKGESVSPLRRLYGDDFVLDESVWHGQITDGRQFHLDGRSGPVSFRLLHVFEFRDGKILRENVWCDLAAIQQQLGCAPSQAVAATAAAA
ncbi:nuclear transport factor 2 family protein [Roseomonas frigidaquae]|uniref:Nuclear transport factor 2 family protein n=1 Tax=Falsiroseomonas frigidaquae TaxID=487318 RepID=A0ABX1F8S4_9PROT|nr:nuclear transport factor 2 family protein [Falsiroseomonas frigidaquae]NKE48616.1 nuclear transport factor 2 family protein [Falsiroseomonas frigidaquae]